MVDAFTLSSVIFTSYYSWVCVITNHSKKLPIRWEIKWDMEIIKIDLQTWKITQFLFSKFAAF